MSQPNFDWMREPLTPWLTAQLPGASGLVIRALSPAVGAGVSAQTLFVDVEYRRDGVPTQRTLALRRQNEGTDLFFEADLRLPWRMMQTVAARSAVPVPPLVGIELDRSILDAPFFVTEKVEGRIPALKPNYNVSGWIADLKPQQRGELWSNALKVLAQIHALDWRDGFDFLDQPARGQPGLEQYLKWVEEWYEWGRQERSYPICEAGLDYLRRERPRDAAVGVLWGDPNSGNLLFRDDLTVGAALDWEMATLGPPEADLAWWLFFDEFNSREVGIERLAGLPDRTTTVALYESFAGRKVRNLEYYDVLAAFRMAVVFIRCADRMIALKRIRPDSEAGANNPPMRMLARRLGLEEPPLGTDFVDLVVALGIS